MVQEKSCKEKSGVSGLEFDFKSTKAGRGSRTSNHSFIMPAEREGTGVFSRRIRQQVGYLETSLGQGIMAPGARSWAAKGQRDQWKIDGLNSLMSDHLSVRHWY